MAAPDDNSVWNTPKVYKHHEQQSVCHSRPKYREGRRLKAVKVYTINLESRFLLVQGVPAIGVMTELVQLFALYGVIEEYRVLDEYPTEQFTEVYLIKFQRLTSARAAKRNTDEKSFFGGPLHVCYAPEHETVEDTRHKLQDRRRFVNGAIQTKAKGVERHEGSRKPATETSETAATSEKSSYPATGESNYLGFPLLPLPPQEDIPYHSPFNHSLKGQTLPGRTVPTEDKMGSLHHSIDTSKQPTLHVNPGSFVHGDREVNNRKSTNPPPTLRFLPRTTHLESRKRKMETGKDSLLGIMDKNKPLIGPKLPEPPKMDMEDVSLNITAKLIRNTMAKITSVPEQKPAEKKTTSAKPRRRI